MVIEFNRLLGKGLQRIYKSLFIYLFVYFVYLMFIFFTPRMTEC